VHDAEVEKPFPGAEMPASHPIPLSPENAAMVRPTRVRWFVMGCITLVTILNYLDRLNFSVAGKYIQDELSLSTQTMGWLFSAFLLGYAICQVPGGWAGDRYGPRDVLTVAILLWSTFTALTGLAPDLPTTRLVGMAGSLMIVRFFVGVGEAANSPNNNRIVSSWMGEQHRGFGSSFTILGIGIGGALTPPVIALVMQHWGWRSSFYLSGLAGLFITLLWQWYVTDRPEEHSSVNQAELKLIRAGRPERKAPARGSDGVMWRKMLSNMSVWGLVLGYFCQGYPIYFYHTWFFIYLVQVRHLTITKGGMWGATPYIGIALLAPVGGWFSDFAVRRLGRRYGRRLAVWLGMFTSGILLWVGSHASNNVSAILLLALGAGFNMFAATTFWAACIDHTERFTGSLSGLMNTFGNLGGWVSPIATAYIATRFGWDRALDCAAAVSIASGLFWLLVRADRSLDSPGETRQVPERLKEITAV
jgi:ACS family glucarate transporter-like MFS transporter